MFCARAEMQSEAGSKTQKYKRQQCSRSRFKTSSTTRVAQGPLKTYTWTQILYTHLHTEGKTKQQKKNLKSKRKEWRLEQYAVQSLCQHVQHVPLPSGTSKPTLWAGGAFHDWPGRSPSASSLESSASKVQTECVRWRCWDAHRGPCSGRFSENRLRFSCRANQTRNLNPDDLCFPVSHLRLLNEWLELGWAGLLRASATSINIIARGRVLVDLWIYPPSAERSAQSSKAVPSGASGVKGVKGQLMEKSLHTSLLWPQVLHGSRPSQSDRFFFQEIATLAFHFGVILVTAGV